MKKSQGKYILAMGLVGIGCYCVFDTMRGTKEWDDMNEPLPFDYLPPLQEVDEDSIVPCCVLILHTPS